MIAQWKQHARQIRIDVVALVAAYRDPRTPWYARLWAALVVAYAFSPIDLIPDPIPVLGYLDDLILVPLGIWIALRLIPPAVLADARDYARDHEASDRGLGRIGAVIVALIWLAFAAAIIAMLLW